MLPDYHLNEHQQSLLITMYVWFQKLFILLSIPFKMLPFEPEISLQIFSDLPCMGLVVFYGTSPGQHTNYLDFFKV